MANRRKPISVRLEEGGFYRPSRHGPKPERPLSLPASDDTPPEGLKGAAREEWLRLHGMLSQAGILTAGEAGVFHAYCFHFGVFVEAAGKVAALGYFPQKADGSGESEHQSKWLRLAFDASALTLKFAQSLGLTPASRGMVVPVRKAQPSAETERPRSALDGLGGPLRFPTRNDGA